MWLLEPVVKLSVTVPDAYTGEVISDLNGKRGRILGMNPDDGVTLIEAEVPLAEVQRYAQDLRSVSQGRGTYSLEFDHYDQVPANLEPKVIEDAKKDSSIIAMKSLTIGEGGDIEPGKREVIETRAAELKIRVLNSRGYEDDSDEEEK